jgi:hypothetical protein
MKLSNRNCLTKNLVVIVGAAGAAGFLSIPAIMYAADHQQSIASLFDSRAEAQTLGTGDSSQGTGGTSTTNPSFSSPSTTSPSTTNPSFSSPSTTSPSTTNPSFGSPSTTSPSYSSPSTTSPSNVAPLGNQPGQGQLPLNQSLPPLFPNQGQQLNPGTVPPATQNGGQSSNGRVFNGGAAAPAITPQSSTDSVVEPGYVSRPSSEAVPSIGSQSSLTGLRGSQPGSTVAQSNQSTLGQTGAQSPSAQPYAEQTVPGAQSTYSTGANGASSQTANSQTQYGQAVRAFW